MIKFDNYPISIIYSQESQDWFNRNGASDEMTDWQAAAVTQDDTTRYDPKAIEYEQYVKLRLQLIASTQVGQLLLGMIKSSVPVSIVPSLFNNGYDAKTQQVPFGSFSPTSVIVFIGKVLQNKFDSTLVHELTHALRMSNHRYYQRNMSLDETGFGSSEEFFAYQIENIYRSSLKQPLWNSYEDDTPRTKSHLYDFIRNQPEIIMVLKYFLMNEPFARRVAGLRHPEYNPFRDLPVLERISLNTFGIREYMPYQ